MSITHKFEKVKYLAYNQGTHSKIKLQLLSPKIDDSRIYMQSNTISWFLHLKISILQPRKYSRQGKKPQLKTGLEDPNLLGSELKNGFWSNVSFCQRCKTMFSIVPGWSFDHQCISQFPVWKSVSKSVGEGRAATLLNCDNQWGKGIKTINIDLYIYRQDIILRNAIKVK